MGIAAVTFVPIGILAAGWSLGWLDKVGGTLDVFLDDDASMVVGGFVTSVVLALLAAGTVLVRARRAGRSRRTAGNGFDLVARIFWAYGVGALAAIPAVLTFSLAASRVGHPMGAVGPLTSIVVVTGFGSLIVALALSVSFTVWRRRKPFAEGSDLPGQGDGA